MSARGSPCSSLGCLQDYLTPNKVPSIGPSGAEAVLADTIFVYKGSLIWRAAADRCTGGLGLDSFLPALVLENVLLNPSGFCYRGLQTELIDESVKCW